MSGQASTKTRTGFSIFENKIRTDILQPGAGNCCHKLALSGNSDEESCVYILLNLKSAKFALWNKQIQNWCECEIEGEDDDNPFVDVISTRVLAQEIAYISLMSMNLYTIISGTLSAGKVLRLKIGAFSG
ncbi:hypothetical protein CUMW_018290 [Citrus unshiu]|nr:hypothetical protein CUMW_018290 [Citrus unshiu]